MQESTSQHDSSSRASTPRPIAVPPVTPPHGRPLFRYSTTGPVRNALSGCVFIAVGIVSVGFAAQSIPSAISIRGRDASAISPVVRGRGVAKADNPNDIPLGSPRLAIGGDCDGGLTASHASPSPDRLYASSIGAQGIVRTVVRSRSTRYEWVFSLSELLTDNNRNCAPSIPLRVITTTSSPSAPISCVNTVTITISTRTDSIC